MELPVCQVVLQQRSVLMKYLRFRMVFKSVGNKFEQNLIIKVSIPRYFMVIYHIFTSIQVNLNFFFFFVYNSVRFDNTIHKGYTYKIEIAYKHLAIHMEHNIYF